MDVVSPRPGSITPLEPITLVGMIKSPPSGQPREFSTAESIVLSIRSNGGHEIKEVKDDLKSSVGVDAEREESSE